MRNSYRTLALTISLAAAAAAFAQAPPAKPSNPTSRGENVFSYPPLSGAPANTIGNPLNNTGIGRQTSRSQTARVTPVPEPSQWAMMLAGLALVGFIVRRSSKRS